MSEREERVWEALRGVKFPGMSRDVVSFGFVQSVEAEDGVRVVLRIPTQNPGAGEQIKEEVEKALLALDMGAVEVALDVVLQERPERAQQQAISTDPGLLSGVQHVIAVASGKGGVGKSTVSSNLAVALAQLGYRVGLMDADIYGPSMPLMFGISDKPRVTDTGLLPFEKYGVRLMSLGFVLDIDTPVIWRGPMVMKAIEQLLGDVEWGELDYMIIDLPPGTGDAQLTLTQKVPLTGAVIVSTPQDVALIDARKGLAMFRKVNVPVLGMIENMSGFECPHCDKVVNIFGADGARRTAHVLDCPFLGKIPLDASIVLGGDNGVPVVHDEGPLRESFQRVAHEVIAQVASQAPRGPSFTIS
ncbi:MAG: Mrp/NBP35 family ATP-binding protein [Acidobacteriota bacterium]